MKNAHALLSAGTPFMTGTQFINPRNKHTEALMKKRFLAMVLSMALALAMLTTAGCGTSNPSDTKYWFSKHSTDFVAFDDNEYNLTEAGTYWYFTAAKNIEVTMSIIMNVDNFTSGAYLYVNGTQVKSEANPGVYTYAYKLSLKRGDEIKIHAFWINSLVTNETGFEIKQLSMTADGKTYLLTEFDHFK